MKRVYYSAYVPVAEDSRLPAIPPDSRRENRLYQADWLLRFYGFSADEIAPQDGNLDLDLDPKSQWALRNSGMFPIEVNTASYEALLRVPGIGTRNAYRIVAARRYSVLTFDSLKKMRVSLPKAGCFITANGEYLGVGDDPVRIRARLTKTDLLPMKGYGGGYVQTSLFESTVFGEL
jgi:predicted DNA-binding helix-hairpin-helix protein